MTRHQRHQHQQHVRRGVLRVTLMLLGIIICFRFVYVDQISTLWIATTKSQKQIQPLFQDPSDVVDLQLQQENDKLRQQIDELQSTVSYWKNKAEATAAAAEEQTTSSIQNEPSQQQQQQQQQQRKTTELETMATSTRAMATYGPNVTHCSLTVLFMEPNIPYLPSTDMMYKSALESVGEYAPQNACVVLQVSSCIMMRQLMKQQQADDDLLFTTNEEFEANKVRETIVSNIYDKSGPFFRQRMDAGRVRITFLDHQKYHLKACDNFYNPSYAWLNYYYWGNDEFVPGVDNDMVLVMQGDAVLCRPFLESTLKYWKQYAWVGSPWNVNNPTIDQKLSPLWNAPDGKYYNEMHNKTFRKYWEEGAESNNNNKPTTTTTTTTREYPFPQSAAEVFPHKCSVGNGGLSLRSRKWIQRALRTCPIVGKGNISGLAASTDANEAVSNCTIGYGMEDMFYIQVLRIIGAPFPIPIVAALFANDGVVLDTVLRINHPPTTKKTQNLLVDQHWLGGRIPQQEQQQPQPLDADPADPVEQHWFRKQLLEQQNGHIMPIGLHKGWRTSYTSKWDYSDMRSKCKYLIPLENWSKGGGLKPGEENLIARLK